MMHAAHTHSTGVILLSHMFVLYILLRLGGVSIHIWVIAFSFCCLLPAETTDGNTK